jgi:hypothetical protein
MEHTALPGRDTTGRTGDRGDLFGREVAIPHLPLDSFKGGWSAQSCLSNASAACSLFSLLKATFQEQLVQVYDALLEVIFHAILRCTMTWSIDPCTNSYVSFSSHTYVIPDLCDKS